MFNGLEDEIEKSEDRESDQASRVGRYLIIIVVWVLAYCGLVLSLWYLE